MNEEKLNVYCVMFAKHEDKEWSGYCGFIFAPCEEAIPDLLAEQYGEVHVRSVQKIDVKAGTVLYGERWRAS